MAEMINNDIEKKIEILDNEYLLAQEPFWIEIKAELGVRYKISGYVRAVEEENYDAALIIFDLGSYRMDIEQLKMYDLKYSKVGTYAYLPVKKGISVWSYDIPIVENMTKFRIGFRTWKNKGDIVVNKDIQIKKDISFAKLQKELEYEKERNRTLQISLYNEKLTTAKIKNMLSFQLGQLLVHSTKSWKNFLKLPFDIYLVSKNWKKWDPSMYREEINESFEWYDISSKIFTKTLTVIPNNELILKGKIIASEGEKRFAALVQVEFLDVTIAKESAKRLHLKYSEKIGFYEYLPTDNPGVRDWVIKFKIPEFCHKIKLNFMSWFNNGPIRVYLAEETSVEGIKPKVSSKICKKLENIYHQKGEEKAEAFIIESDLPNHHRADLYEVLASLSSNAKKRSDYYKYAYENDPSYFRAVRLFRYVVDGGHLETAKNILNDFEKKHHKIRPQDMRNVMYAKGYVSLYKTLPTLPENIITPPRKNSYKTLMFLHTSLPHHSNGYATRSHAILKTMMKSSRYNVTGVSRSGYPLDVGVSSFSEKEEVEGVTYIRLTQAHYYDQPLDEYMRTAADDIQKLIQKENPSIIHSASAFYTALPALIAARREGLPFIYEVRGLWEVTRASTIPGWGDTERFELERQLETLVAKEADQVVAITEGLKEELIRRGVEREKITVIPNAINKEQFNPQKPKNTLRQQIGLSDAPVIGYVGSVVDYEGLDYLLDALSILKKEGIAFNFMLLGDGKALKELKEKVKELQLQKEVFILGRIPHEKVAEYYALIDITPFPRKSLPVCEMVSPLKPFEAMALGKTVIASNVKALEEIIIDNETGLLFEKDNVKELAEKLKIVLLNEKFRKRLAINGRKWVLANRNWSQIALKFDDVYDQAFLKNQLNLKTKIEQLSQERPISLLVYGDLNLNYVDGSAVWAASLVEMLAGFKNVSVTFLLKADLTHETLIESLKKFSNVKIISPSETNIGKKLLQPDDAIEVLSELQKKYQFDGVILRGFHLNKAAAKKKEFSGKLWPYMIDIFHKKDAWNDEIVSDLNDIAEVSYTIFCQTTHIESFLISRISSAKGKTSLLPPMVPDQGVPKKDFDLTDRPLRMVYAGKFAPLWGTREMLKVFNILRKKGLNVELHVYGDKIHNPPDDTTFYGEVKDALEKTEGLFWHGAVPREEVLKALPTYDIAWAWRKPELEENTDEVSTKFLEYSSVGLPMIVVPNKITVKLLGKEYPLFANKYESLVPLIEKILSNPSIIKTASKKVYEASKPFSFSVVRKKFISPLITPLSKRKYRKVILFTGHDFKFVEKLMQKFKEHGYEVLIDKWKNHTQHDESLSKTLLKRADIIFCEWALGNAVWYSKHKLPFQKMFVRFHRQEIETDFPGQIDYNAIDAMTFIVPHVQRKSIEKYQLHKYKNKCIYIPNYVDTKELDRPKSNDARFNLGIVGIVPKMKRFDRALDILEALRKKDKRYRLFVKGKLAKEYPWMLNRPDEMVYYEELEKRIDKSPLLKGAVYYDGFGKDMGTWFSKIGYILSTSDYEGSHLSVAEAMASGSTPLIIKWDGADEIYPPKYCFSTTKDAVKFVLKETDESFTKHIEENKEFVKEFDIENIFNKWEKLCNV
jgi:PEP-CTERM/exosortase A-associated glycosyltransferase